MPMSGDLPSPVRALVRRALAGHQTGLSRLAAAAAATLLAAAALAVPAGSSALAAASGGQIVASGQAGSGGPPFGLDPLPVPSDQLTSLSCAGSSFCAAIGDDGSGRTFTAVWRGTAWQLGPSPASGLSGISCTSATFCLAIGGGGAQTWNGQDWKALPKPPAAAAVSCVSSTFCMAVDGGADSRTITHEWNGTGWRTHTVTFTCPPFHGGCDAELTRVSCVSTTFCMTVGEIGSDTPQSIAAEWTGGSWTQESTPTIDTHSAGLDSVSCTAASFCMAVGTTPQDQPTMMTWDGVSWQVQTASEANPTAVTCTSDTSCVAASSAAIQVWVAGAWQPFAPVAAPGGTTIALSGLSCSGSPVSHCMMTGDYGTAALGTLTLAEQWNGADWTVLHTASPGAVDGLFSVSCPRASFCMGVGTFVGSGDVQQALAETWNGHRWTVLTPLSPGVELNYLAGVDCTSSSNCVAVGSFDTVLGQRQALAERWNGRTWTQLDAVDPGLNDQLTAVACSTATHCMAVGTSSAPTRVHTLAEQWNGAGWTVRTTPDPGSTHPVQQFSYLSAVSCPGAKACVAVGYYNKRLPSGRRPLAIAWNGTSWRSLRTPGSNGELASVSCLNASQCLAVGADTNGLGLPTRPLAQQWNGHAWVQHWPAGTGQGTVGELDGVACGAVASCQATGGFSTSGGQVLDFAESWNGSSWHRVTTASPSPAFSELYSISCARATACLAVGERSTQLPLAQSWNGTHWGGAGTSEPLTGLGQPGRQLVCLTVGAQRGSGQGTRCLDSAHDGFLRRQAAQVGQGKERLGAHHDGQAAFELVDDGSPTRSQVTIDGEQRLVDQAEPASWSQRCRRPGNSRRDHRPHGS
jgi:hypothetical protein